ncbi:hypothetical protein QZH41_008009 [Actinostola sp. cb2023]|nr:hypothetical protein QZH41_008009 [Actinostola sp. cb2023]
MNGKVEQSCLCFQETKNFKSDICEYCMCNMAKGSTCCYDHSICHQNGFRESVRENGNYIHRAPFSHDDGVKDKSLKETPQDKTLQDDIVCENHIEVDVLSSGGDVPNCAVSENDQPATVDIRDIRPYDKHDMEEMTFHGHACDGTVCRECGALFHREHTFLDHTNPIKNVKFNMSEMMENFDNKQTVLNNKITSLDLTLGRKSQEIEQAKQKIQSTTFQLKKLISEQEKTLLSCLDSHYSNVSRQIKGQKTDLQSALDEVNQSIEIAREMLRNNGSKSLNGHMNAEPTIVPDTTAKVTIEAGHVIPNDSKEYINQMDDDSGICDDDYNVRYSEGISLERAQIPNDTIQPFVPEKFTFNHEMSLGTQGDCQVKDPVGVTTSQDGSIFVADYTRDRIQIFDRLGQFVCTMSHVSTDSGRKTAFLCPTGLATDKTGNIVIAERGRHRITVMTPDGHLRHKFGKLGKAHSQLRDPHGVSVDTRGRIIVTDTANSRIQVFDKDGDFIFVFGHNGDHALDYPSYAIFQKGIFIVSDTDNDSVKVFDKEGLYVRNLTEQREGLFSAPSGLAIYKEEYVLVCDFNNDCVKMFTLEGRFVTKFGSEGSGPGQFSGPEAITVSADGANVLLDFAGDISFDSAAKYFIRKGICSYNDTFAKVAPVFKESDLVIGNLESPFVRPDMKADAQLKFALLICSDPDNVEALKYAGFDIMNLANNHLNDYKTKPINYTVKLLREHGIHSFGYNFGSVEEQRPQNPLIVERNGINIGFLGYCSTFWRNIASNGHVYYYCVKKREELDAGPAIYTDEAATRDVNRLKDKVDIIVVMMHWGVEYVTTPTKRQQKQAAHLQSIGVHVVIGGHPHVLQGHSFSGKSLVSFSLGNILYGPKYKNILRSRYAVLVNKGFETALRYESPRSIVKFCQNKLNYFRFIIDANFNGLHVTVCYFSGRRDPKWLVKPGDQHYTTVVDLLDKAKANNLLHRREDLPAKLGYKGFLVRKNSTTNLELVIGPETKDLQQLLLRSAPEDVVSSSLEGKISEAIDKGNI